MVGTRKEKTGGRKKGTPNKTTAQVKDMIVQALEQAGGVKYLAGQAASSPKDFLALVGKVLPLQVGGDPDNPIEHNHKHQVSEEIRRYIEEQRRGE